MSSFIGSETSVIDAKGRITVPARLRKGLDPDAADTFTIIRWPDGAVHMYPLDEWRRFADKLRRLSKGDDEAKAVFLLLSESAHETTIDGQGRVSLTPRLIELGGLERTARLVGALDHIEIWSPERFDSQVKKATPGFESMLKNVFGRLDGD
jgi:MraZ protein